MSELSRAQALRYTLMSYDSYTNTIALLHFLSYILNNCIIRNSHKKIEKFYRQVLFLGNHLHSILCPFNEQDLSKGLIVFDCQTHLKPIIYANYALLYG